MTGVMRKHDSVDLIGIVKPVVVKKMATDTGSVRGRHIFFTRIFVFPFILIMALITPSFYDMALSSYHVQNMEDTTKQFGMMIELGRLLMVFQDERTECAFFIFSNGQNKSALHESFARTDAILEEEYWFGCNETFVKTILRHLANFSDVRRRVLRAEGKGKEMRTEITESTLRWYVIANDYVLEEIRNQIGDTGSDHTSRLIIAYEYILRAFEQITISIVYGAQKYSLDVLAIEDVVLSSKHRKLGYEYLLAIPHVAPNLIPESIQKFWDSWLSRQVDKES